MVQDIIKNCCALIILTARNTVFRNFCSFCQRCFSFSLCHIDLPIWIIILEFLIGIIALYPAPEYCSSWNMISRYDAVYDVFTKQYTFHTLPLKFRSICCITNVNIKFRFSLFPVFPDSCVWTMIYPISGCQCSAWFFSRQIRFRNICLYFW